MASFPQVPDSGEMRLGREFHPQSGLEELSSATKLSRDMNVQRDRCKSQAIEMQTGRLRSVDSFE